MAENDGDNKGDKLLYCSFCGKSQHEVRKLIAGPSVFVCDECVELCNEIIREEAEDVGAEDAHEAAYPSPQEICKRLDDYVIGQTEALLLGFLILIGVDYSYTTGSITQSMVSENTHAKFSSSKNVLFLAKVLSIN